MVHVDREAWLRFNRAIFHYESLGFSYLDVPWAVAPHITAMTKPPEAKDYPFGEQCLVGSAEQGFLSLLGSDSCPDKELYYSITPCFRDEIEDQFHKKYFMKLELITRNRTKFHTIFNAAYSFFLSEVEDIGKLTFSDIGKGKDIFYKGIEIGSYYKNSEYVCGTGLAEPRFTIAQDYGYDNDN